MDVKRQQNTTDVGIKTLHHLTVRPLRAAVAMANVADSFRLRLIVRALPWPMWRREMQTEQKWLFRLGIAFDRFDGAIPQQVRHVPVPLDRDLLFVKLV